MQQTFHSQSLVHLDIRPKRGCYLVASQSRTQFRRAVMHASSRWGGIQELILPTTPAGRIAPAFLQLTESLNPDVVFDVVGLSSEGRDRVTKEFGISPIPVERESDSRVGRQYGAHPLLAYPEPLLDGLEITTLVGRSITDIAATGSFSEWHVGEQWTDLGARLTITEDPVRAGIAQLHEKTLISATGSSCGEISTAMVGEFAVLLVAQRSSLRSALWFWNLRALMPLGFGRSPIAIVDRDTAFSEEFRQALVRSVMTKRSRTTPDLIIFSLDSNRRELSAIRRRLGFRAPQDRRRGARHIFVDSGASRGRLTAGITWDPRRFLLGNRTPGIRASAITPLTKPETEVRMASPISFRPRVGGSVRVCLSGPDAWRAPENPETARVFADKSMWDSGRIGFDVGASATYQLTVRLPEPDEVLAATLRSRGYEYELSSPGRLADVLLSQIPSGLHLFDDPATSRVILSLTRPRTDRIIRALRREFRGVPSEEDVRLAKDIVSPQPSTGRSAAETASSVQLSESETAGVLEAIASLGLADRGARIRCSTCSLVSFLPFQNMSDRPRCPGCRTDQDLAVDANGRPTFVYRLNSLLDRASDQGVLCHIYLATRLLADDPNRFLVLGALVTGTSGATEEVDLLTLEGTNLVSGEAKQKAEQFSTDQIRRDVKLSSALRASTHVMACLEPLPEMTIDYCRDLCEHLGVELRVIAPEAGETG